LFSAQVKTSWEKQDDEDGFVSESTTNESLSPLKNMSGAAAGARGSIIADFSEIMEHRTLGAEPTIMKQIKRRKQTLAMSFAPEPPKDLSSPNIISGASDSDDISVSGHTAPAAASYNVYCERYASKCRELKTAGPSIMTLMKSKDMAKRVGRKLRAKHAKEKVGRRRSLMMKVKPPVHQRVCPAGSKKSFYCEVCEQPVPCEFSCGFCTVVLCSSCVSDQEDISQGESRCRWCVNMKPPRGHH
jgi:hypothetical protein